MLGHSSPGLAMVRIRSKAPAQHLLLLLGGAALELKLVELGPEVTDVRLQCHSTVVPAPRLVHLAVVLEQLGHSRNDVGVVVAPLEGVDRLGPPLRPWRHSHHLCPQAPAGGAVLQGLGQQHLRSLCVAATLLGAHGREPQVLVLGVLEPGLLQRGARLAVAAALLVQPRCRRPQGDATQAVPAAPRVGRPGRCGVAQPLLQLAKHHPQLPGVGELLQALLQQGTLRLRRANLSLHDGALHPHSGGGRLLLVTGLLQDGAGALRLLVLELQLEGRKVDLLTSGVGGEGFLENLPGIVHFSGQPLLLGRHEPEHGGGGAVVDSTPQQLVQGLACAMGLLQLSSTAPDALLVGEDSEGVGVDGSGCFHGAATQELLSVCLPGALAVLCLDADPDDRVHNALAGGKAWWLGLLGVLGLLEPRIAVDDDAMVG
mmetsp:Transcript_33560/g.94960  ORF Transcript_33560/g.94960 Transcript_33560/m.94960 type:complete len:429 (-) Transcript_33560:1498-2784(-)